MIEEKVDLYNYILEQGLYSSIDSFGKGCKNSKTIYISEERNKVIITGPKYSNLFKYEFKRYYNHATCVHIKDMIRLIDIVYSSVCGLCESVLIKDSNLNVLINYGSNLNMALRIALMSPLSSIHILDEQGSICNTITPYFDRMTIQLGAQSIDNDKVKQSIILVGKELRINENKADYSLIKKEVSNKNILIKEYNDNDIFLNLKEEHKIIMPKVKDGICQHTNIKVGKDTGYVDKFNNKIYSNSLLLDIDGSLASIDEIEYETYQEYGISNYHCSHCPIHSSSIRVIGIDDENYNSYYYIMEK